MSLVILCVTIISFIFFSGSEKEKEGLPYILNIARLAILKTQRKFSQDKVAALLKLHVLTNITKRPFCKKNDKKCCQKLP